MINILKAQLSAEWNKPKAKNAKEGQEPRNEEFIKELQAKINAIKQDELAVLTDMLVTEQASIPDFNDYDLLGEDVPSDIATIQMEDIDHL